MLLDVAFAILVEGLTYEQRETFTKELASRAGSGDRSAASVSRRAYALRYGELT